MNRSLRNATSDVGLTSTYAVTSDKIVDTLAMFKDGIISNNYDYISSVTCNPIKNILKRLVILWTAIHFYFPIKIIVVDWHKFLIVCIVMKHPIKLLCSAERRIFQQDCEMELDVKILLNLTSHSNLIECITRYVRPIFKHSVSLIRTRQCVQSWTSSKIQQTRTPWWSFHTANAL